MRSRLSPSWAIKPPGRCPAKAATAVAGRASHIHDLLGDGRKNHHHEGAGLMARGPGGVAMAEKGIRTRVSENAKENTRRRPPIYGRNRRPPRRALSIRRGRRPGFPDCFLRAAALSWSRMRRFPAHSRNLTLPSQIRVLLDQQDGESQGPVDLLDLLKNGLYEDRGYSQGTAHRA